MRKERALKYLILTFMAIVSFFMFSKVSVRAAEIEYEQNGVVYTLEEINESDALVGYNIKSVRVVASCETGNVCAIESLVVPDAYNDIPIVGVNDGDAVASVGAFDGLKEWSVGSVAFGDNISYIGNYAFANVSVEKIYIYGFATNISENTFSSISGNYDIVFENSTIYGGYSSKDVWSSLSDKLTYKIVCRFVGAEIEDNDCYYMRSLGSIPAISQGADKQGFNFIGWKDVFGNPVDSNYVVEYCREDNGAMVNVINPEWELEAPDINIKTFFGSIELLTHSMSYSGKTKKMDIVVSVSHNLDTFAVVEYSWKSDIPGVEISNSTNSISIGYVNESGKYTCYVTISYDGYSRTDEISVDAEISPRELKIVFKDQTVPYGTYAVIDNDSYDIDLGTSFAENEKIKEFTSSKYVDSNHMNCGSYEGVLFKEIENIGYDGDDKNYIKNYAITYETGDLNVEPKEIYVDLMIENPVVEYGDEENMVASFVDKAYEDSVENVLNLVYERELSNLHEVGDYKITNVSVANNSNYTVKLNIGEMYKFSIVPKKVDVVFVLDEDMVYNGKEKDYAAYYVDNNEENIYLDVWASKGGQETKLVNAGDYTISVNLLEIDHNYELIQPTKTVTIEKAASVLIGDTRQETMYNGKKQTVNVALNHNETVLHHSGECKNAQTACVVRVTATESANYKGIQKDFVLKIKEYTIKVVPDVYTFLYGNIITGSLKKEYNGVTYFDEATNSEVTERVGVNFYANANDAPNVGSYDITFASADTHSSGNYVIDFDVSDGVGKVVILPAPIVVSFNYFGSTVYDGNVKEVAVRIEDVDNNTVPECEIYDGVEFNECINNYFGLTARYDGNKVPKNAGEYRLVASLNNPNYQIEGKNYYDLTIQKANYDVSNLKLEDKKVAFNFKNHFIRLEGKLPEGLQAVYTIDDNRGNGTLLPFKHTVKVSFVGDYENYNYVEPLVAVLNISLDWLWIALGCILGLFAVCFATSYLLIRNGKLRFYRRINRKQLIRIKKQKLQIEAINALIRRKKEELEKDNEKEIVIEENVTFIKNPNVERVDMIDLSFVDEMFKASDETKQYYSEVKNELLSYEGITDKIKRDYETFYLNGMPVAKLDVVNGELYAYFALDPTMYNAEEYKHENVKKNKEYAGVPLKLRVNSIDSLRHAKMFVRIIRKRENIKSVSNFVRLDYAKIYTVKEGSFKMFKKVFEKKIGNGKVKGKKSFNYGERHLALSIVLSFVTFGIYTLYWIAKVNDEMLVLSKNRGRSGVKVVLLTLVTLGIYGIIWAYRMGTYIDKLQDKKDGKTKFILMILNMLCLSVVSIALIQNTINEYHK